VVEEEVTPELLEFSRAASRTLDKQITEAKLQSKLEGAGFLQNSGFLSAIRYAMTKLVQEGIHTQEHDTEKAGPGKGWSRTQYNPYERAAQLIESYGQSWDGYLQRNPKLDFNRKRHKSVGQRVHREPGKDSFQRWTKERARYLESLTPRENFGLAQFFEVCTPR